MDWRYDLVEIRKTTQLQEVKISISNSSEHIRSTEYETVLLKITIKLQKLGQSSDIKYLKLFETTVHRPKLN